MGTGDNIRAARKRAHMTQAQLAEAAGIAPISVGNYERGIREPRLEQLLKIAKALDVSIYALILPYDLEDPAAALYVSVPEQLAELMEQLNEAGELEVLKRAEEVVQLPKYRKDGALYVD